MLPVVKRRTGTGDIVGVAASGERTVLGACAPTTTERWSEIEDDLRDFATTSTRLGDVRLLLFAETADALWMARRLLDGTGTDDSRDPWLALAMTCGRVVERGGLLVGRPVDECLALLERARVGDVIATEPVATLAAGRADCKPTPLNQGVPAAGAPAYELNLSDRRSTLVDALPRELSALERHSVFCGREPDLLALERAWEATVASDERRVAIISGEPGVGKTRLLARLAASLARRGAPIFYGRCHENSGSAFGPIVEAFAEHGSASSWPGPSWRAGEAYTSQAALDFVNVFATPGGVKRGELDVRAAVAAQLGAASASAPALLLIDDLQWVDGATLQLLLHLLDSEEPVRGLAAVTVRSGEIEEGSAAALALQRVRRRPGTVDRRLSGLERHELSILTRSFLGSGHGEEEDELTGIIHAETAGNALFATELLRSLDDSGALSRPAAGADPLVGIRLPATVTETIRQRVDRLGDDAVEALTVAAICGAEFDLDLLQECLGWEVRRMEAALLRAERAGLLSERRGGAMGFSHGLVMRALTERTGSAAGARVHRRIGEAIEGLPQRRRDERVEALARHWLSAFPPDPVRAVDYAQRAGRQALADSRSSAALEFYGAALRLHGHASDGRRCQLLLGLGLAQQGAGLPAFRETLLEAGRLADELDELWSLNASVLANHRGFVSASGAVDPERIAMLEVAIARAGKSDPAYPLLLATLAAELAFSGEERRFALSDRALERARSLGSEATLASVLVSRFVTIWIPETLGERLENSAESVEIADRLDDPLLQFKAVHWRSVALVQAGEIVLGAEMVERENRLAGHFGDPVSLWISRYDRANMAIIGGRLDEAERLANEALELATSSSQPDAMPFYGSQLANIRYEQGRLAELQGLLAQVVADNPGIPAFRSVLALACMESELPDQARALLANDAAGGFELIPRDVTWLAGHVIYAHVAADLGDREAAATLLERLEPHVGMVVYTGISAWGDVGHALGRLAGLLGRDDADELLERSCARYKSIEAPIWLARGRLDAARVKLERGDAAGRERALQLLEHAIADARRWGAASIERRAAGLRENARASAVYGAVRARPPAAAPAPAAGGERASGPTLSIEGDVWSFERGGRVTRVRDSIGIRYLAELLANPGVEFHAADLQAGASTVPEGASATSGLPTRPRGGEVGQAVLDDAAKRAYRERIGELRAELAEAESFNDPERAERCRDELDAIGQELSAALGLGGRDRGLSSTAERARLNVTRAIRRTIAKVAEADADLGAELDRSIRTGTFCAYESVGSRALEWQVRRGPPA